MCCDYVSRCRALFFAGALMVGVILGYVIAIAFCLWVGLLILHPFVKKTEKKDG